MKGIFKTTYVLAVIYIVFSGNLQYCQEPKYPGFSKNQEGVYYQLHTIGEDIKQPKPGMFIIGEVKLYADSQLVYATNDTFLAHKEKKAIFYKSLEMFNEGDSATLIFESPEMLTGENENPEFAEALPAGKSVRMDVRLDHVLTAKELVKLRQITPAIREVAMELDLKEYRDLKDYLISENIGPDKISSTGLVIAELNRGDGVKIDSGKWVMLHYEGRFINGKIFDSTKKRGEAFEFVFGQEGQLIKGLEEVVGQMSANGKARVIVPSHLAFGNNGSQMGGVPPYTSLIYDVEVLKVN